jgi:hypothetical protein
MPASKPWRVITFGNNNFLAIGRSSTAAAYSTDGITWSTSTLPAASQWIDVRYINSLYTVSAVSNSSNFTVSTNAITWTLRTVSISSGIYAMSYRTWVA